MQMKHKRYQKGHGYNIKCIQNHIITFEDEKMFWKNKILVSNIK